MTGIPQVMPEPLNRAAVGDPGHTPTNRNRVQLQASIPEGGETDLPLPEGDSQSGELSALRNHPMFEEIRDAIRANPQMLGTIIQMLGTQNPELVQRIANNQDEFLRLLEENDPSAQRQTDRVQISLTPDELAAVRRLENLGFPQTICLQAYLACDKNEDLAANYLFDNSADFMDEEEPSA